MQVNFTVNIRDDFGKLFGDRCTQGDRYIQGRQLYTSSTVQTCVAFRQFSDPLFVESVFCLL